jgi:hypothetical protein
VIALESDLKEYYHCDLRDLWVKGSGVTVRWVVSKIDRLAQRPDSALFRHVGGDRALWDKKDHLLADNRDLLRAIQYLTLYLVQAQFGKASKKIFDNMPEPPLRPGDEPPKIEFATKDELFQLFGKGKPRGRKK